MIRVTMGNWAHEELAPHAEGAVAAALEGATFRNQGTGRTAVMDVGVGVAREMAAAFRARASYWNVQPRGTGAASMRKGCDRIVSRIEASLFEATGPTGDGISSAGLVQKGKTLASLDDFKAARVQAEPKIDGWRGTIHVVGGELADVWIGNGRENVNLHIRHVARAAAALLPEGTVLDCELAVLQHGGPAPDHWGGIQGILGGHPKEESRQLLASAVVFDLIAHAGDDLRARPFSERRRQLETLDLGVDWAMQLSPIVEPTEDGIRAILALGYEGVMLKDLDAPYRSGKRTKDQGKIKPQTSDDVEVVGFTEGGGAFEGHVGAIVFAGESEDGIELKGQCSGMPWAVREAIGGFGRVARLSDERSFAEGSDLGRIKVGDTIEIAHHGVMPSGGLRHPQFKRLRADK